MTSAQLLGPAEIRDLADLLGLQPTKKLGQNFVIDANTVRRIVKAAGVQPGETVVEVGPGLGSLTLGLLEAGASVTAVEIDQRLAAQLPITVDLLAPGTPRSSPCSPKTRCASPSCPAIRPCSSRTCRTTCRCPCCCTCSRHFPGIERGLVMVQAEVGQRLAAPPGSKVYGSPSAKAAWYGDFRVAGNVSRQVFWPVPNVDSILVRFDRHPLPGTEEERLATFALVDAAFQQRRKMLRQSLSPVLGAEASAVLEAGGVAPTARGEELTVLDFLRVARAR